MPRTGRGKNGNGKKASGTITKGEKDALREAVKVVTGATFGASITKGEKDAILRLLGESFRSRPPVSVEMTETSRKIHEEQNKNNNKKGEIKKAAQAIAAGGLGVAAGKAFQKLVKATQSKSNKISSLSETDKPKKRKDFSRKSKPKK